uniref:Complex 1 LYR protein domain-containing protein n=1 Tax=Gadus morhua TaxID=8049 RepID=A0A8C5CST4_GADMO
MCAFNMATKTQVLSLYRMLLRESKQFPSYNYRTYALQRIKDAFRANRRIEDPKMVAKLAEEGHKTLALIKRQVKLRHTHLYTHTRIHTSSSWPFRLEPSLVSELISVYCYT